MPAGDLLGPSSRAPLGPLDRLLPLFDTGSAGAALVLAAAALAVAGLVAYELHRARARLDGL